METDNPKISIIVPIYNVEKFLERCVRSLFAQHFQEIEYIFIDDCSSDRSMIVLYEIMREYPHKRKQVKIVKNLTNKGIATVRNIGLNEAKGRFIGWVDSDDWIDENMYSDLYEAAVREEADIVWCDYYNTYVEYEELQSQQCNVHVIDYVRALLRGKMHAGLWCTLICRELFFKNQIFFQDGYNVMEDKNVLIKLAYYASKIFYVPKAFYHYVKFNNSSITNAWTPNSLAERAAQYNLQDIFSFIEHSKFANIFYKDIIYAKLIFKKGYLNMADLDYLLHWKAIYPESNYTALYCPNQTLRQRLFGFFLYLNFLPPLRVWIKLKNK